MKDGAAAAIPAIEARLIVSAELAPTTTFTATAGADLPDEVSVAVTVSAYSLPPVAPPTERDPVDSVPMLFDVDSVNDDAPVPPRA